MSTKGRYERSLGYLELTDGQYFLDEHSYPQIFYGRIDKKTSILPLERSSMAPLLNDDPNAAFVLDFVADAFQDMNTKYLTMGLRLFSESPTSGLRPVGGYVSGRSLYFDHILSVINKFIEEDLFLDDESDMISDFHKFIERFEAYATKNLKNTPIVLSTFVTSPLCPPQCSGLIIKLQDIDYEDSDARDVAAVTMTDEFRDLARRYGFVIPRNYPYHLVANIESNVMYEYALNYDIEDFDKKKIVKSYFVECGKFDIDFLKIAMYDGYRRFIEQTPVRVFRSVCKDGSIAIKSVTLDVPDSQPPEMTQRELLPLYFKMLCIEKNIQIRKVLFDTIMEDCYYYFYNQRSFEEMHDYAVTKLLKTKPDKYR